MTQIQTDYRNSSSLHLSHLSNLSNLSNLSDLRTTILSNL